MIDAARSRSLFAPKRVVVVRRAEKLKGDGGDLDAYLADPTPGVTLVLQAGKPDKRRAVWKRLLKKVPVASADPLKGRRLSGYVSDQLRKRKLDVGPDGLEELIQRVGQDLRRLMGEIDKLEAYAQGQALSGADVSEILGRGIGQPIYKLTDAFMARRRDEALKLLDEALEERESGAAAAGLASLHAPPVARREGAGAAGADRTGARQSARGATLQGAGRHERGAPVVPGGSGGCPRGIAEGRPPDQDGNG